MYDPSTMRLHAVATLAIATACASPRAVDAPPPTAMSVEELPTVQLRFKWPRSASFVVTEKKLISNHEAEFRYDVRIEPDDASGGIVIRQTGFTPIAADGVDAKQPKLAGFRRTIEALDDLTPPMRIAANGAFIEHVDLDAAIDALADFSSSQRGETPEKAKATKAALRRPEFRAMLVADLRETWKFWAEGYLDVSGPIGPTQKRIVEEAMSDEVTMPVTYETTIRRRFEHQGADCIEVEILQRIDIGMFEKAAVDLFQGKPVTQQQLQATSLERRTTLGGVFELATLRPHSARMEMRTVDTETGRISDYKRRSFTFDWSRRTSRR